MRGRRAGDGADPASELGFGRFGHLGSPRNRASPSLPCDSVNRTARNGSVGGREPAAGSLLGSWAAALRWAGLPRSRARSHFQQQVPVWLHESQVTGLKSEPIPSWPTQFRLIFFLKKKAVSFYLFFVSYTTTAFDPKFSWSLLRACLDLNFFEFLHCSTFIFI